MNLHSMYQTKKESLEVYFTSKLIFYSTQLNFNLYLPWNKNTQSLQNSYVSPVRPTIGSRVRRLDAVLVFGSMRPRRLTWRLAVNPDEPSARCTSITASPSLYCYPHSNCGHTCRSNTWTWNYIYGM